MAGIKRVFLLVVLFSISVVYGSNETEGAQLAQQLGLDAASKAMIQWERVFKSERKMKRYKINTLSINKQKLLKRYLIDHAIDSDHPTVAGV